MRIKVAWLLNGSTYIAAVCMILFKCWPLHRQWQIKPDPGSASLTPCRTHEQKLTCGKDNCYPGASKLNVTFITALNALTDVYLMAIPLPVRSGLQASEELLMLTTCQIIYKAKLDLKKKISLFVLFNGGWIVIIFGILRCVTLVTVRSHPPLLFPQPNPIFSIPPPTHDIVPLTPPTKVPATQPSESGQWSVRESFVAILISNAPMVFPLLKRWSNRALGLSSHSRSHTAGSFPLQDYAHSKSKSKSKSKSGGFKHPLSIPMDTVVEAWASDEAINKSGAGDCGGSGKRSSEGEGEVGSLEERTQGGRPFSGERGSKHGHGGAGRGLGAMQIVKTREYRVTEE